MTSPLTRVLCLVALLAPSAGITAVQGQDSELAGKVGTGTLELVRPMLEAAARDSLPVQALRAKVLEGTAKNRPPQVIAEVVGRLADDLRGTRAAIRAQLPNASIGGEELLAAALARQQGVPMESVAALWSARRAGAGLEVPVTVMAELVRRGVPAAGASALMRHVLSTGVPMERAAQIPGRFDGAARPGSAPPEVLERVLRDLNIPGPPDGVGPPAGRGPPDGPPGGGPPGGGPPGDPGH